MMENRSRPPGIIPTVFYTDVAQAVDWLCGAFGFTERFRYGPEGNVAGAQLSAGDGAVMLSVARVGQSPEGDDRTELRPPRANEGSVVFSVHVEDIDRHFERAKQFGARIVQGPETYPFGERQYTAEDFAGYRWGFSQSVADTAPEEWGGRSGPGLATR